MEQKTVLQELHVIIDEFDNKSRTEIKAVLCWVLHTFNLCFTSFIKHKSTEGENKRQQRTARWAGMQPATGGPSGIIIKKMFKGGQNHFILFYRWKKVWIVSNRCIPTSVLCSLWMFCRLKVCSQKGHQLVITSGIAWRSWSSGYHQRGLDINMKSERAGAGCVDE